MNKICVALLSTILASVAVIAATEPTAKCVKGNCASGTGTMEWSTGDRYEGAWKNGTMSGRGTMTWKDGNRYAGPWKNGLMDGIGTLTTAAGDVYKGQFSAGRISGFGVMKWKSGDSYTGHWMDDLMHGSGTLRYKDGTVLRGDWLNGKHREKAEDGNRDIQGTWGQHCKCTPSASDNYDCWDAVIQLLADGIGKYQKRTGDPTSHMTGWTMKNRQLTVTLMGEDGAPLPGVAPLEFTYDPLKKQFNARPAPFGPAGKKMVVCILKKMKD